MYRIEKVSTDNKAVTLGFYGNQKKKFYFSWLRYHCLCQYCFYLETGQRLISAYLPEQAISLGDLQVSEDKSKITIKWADGHVSEFSLDWLMEDSLNNLYGNPTHFLHDENQLLEKSCFHYRALAEIKDDILLSLNRYGMVLVKNVPCEEGAVVAFTEQFAPAMHTIYGTIFDVKIEKNPINVAYTSLPLELHIDLPYYEAPPGVQLLHCLDFHEKIQGGESTFLDAFFVAEQFRLLHSAEFKVLCEIPGTFQKIHYLRKAPADIIYYRTHIAINHNDEIVAINWAPSFEGRRILREEDIEPYYQAYRLFAKLITKLQISHGVTMRLSPGDLIMFNNRRILHGRHAFSESAENYARHLQGAYISSDDYMNALRIIANKNKKVRLVKIGNYT